MKEKINIVEILKDKPQGTKLYSSACGKCKLEEVDDKSFKISFYNSKFGFMNGGEGYLDKNGKLYDDGECVVFPSKEMRDWSKFAWKKGDVLMADLDNICIFDKWNNDEYTEFDAAFVTPDYRSDVLKTKYWHKVIGVNVIRRYISKIERNNGGKLNLTTLEIEKAQPEFKDGDILCVIESSNNYHYILIYEGQDDEHIYRYVTMLENNSLIIEKGSYFTKPKDYSMRYATEEEKQQLFGALEKEGKAWDSEKKQVVNLKPKVEFKPFDKVLCRNSKDDTWEADFFARLTRKEIDYTQSGKYLCVGDLWMYCIPYNEETAHLLGTTDEWKGGEG
jgi:hypothetical protein